MSYKIIELLKTFTKPEIKSFERFLISPYFNESQKILKLYRLLIKHYPHFDSELLNEENLSMEINPNLKFKKSTFKSLLFDLSSLAEKYLIIEKLNEKSFYAGDFLREQFLKRNLPKYLKQNIEKSELYFSEYKNPLPVYFLELFFLYNDKRNYNTVFVPRSGKNYNTQSISILNDRARALSMFFMNQLKMQYDDLISINFSFEINPENNFVMQLFQIIDFEKIMEFMISSTDNKTHSVQAKINLSFFRLFKEFSNEDHYLRSKSLLIKYAQILGSDEVNSFFIKLITYCRMKSFEKNNTIDFDQEQFGIYKFILHKGYYQKSTINYLPAELFRMVVQHGLKLKKFVWTLNFIKNYYRKLNPEWMMNMYYFGLAEYYFRRKKFDDALRSFQKIQMSHFLLKVDLKSLMLMTFFELGLFENALSVIDTFRHFLSKNEILSDHLKKRYKAFLIAVQKMITFKTSLKPASKYIIKKSIVPHISYKEWLMEKYDELDENVKRSA